MTLSSETNFYNKGEKLCKASNDDHNRERLLILPDFLNEWVADCDVSDPHVFCIEK